MNVILGHPNNMLGDVYWETVGDAIRKGKDTPRFIEKHKEMKLYS